MITGGIIDSDVRENSVVTAVSETTEEALFVNVWLASVAAFLCDLALEVGVCFKLISPGGNTLCDGRHSLCAWAVLSELICTSPLTGTNSPCSSSFFEDVKKFCIPVQFSCLSTLEDVELLCISLLGGVEILCGGVLEGSVPIDVSLFGSFELHRTSTLEDLEPLFICLMEVSEALLICLLEDVVPFCICAPEGVDTLCTNFLEVVTFCACLLEGV
jgi:hypothetical protein